MNKFFAGASALTLLAAAGGVHAADAAGTSAAATVGEVIVTGTRQTGIKAADSAAPIQVVGVQALKRTGATDLALALQTTVPSLNISTTSFDAAAVQVQAALRGLSPNDTLVLVDGKRRHTTSSLAVDGGTAYSGSFTTDLSFIPVDSIDHVEVLTDGAAAQYGSDAIAGVVNIILKKGDTAGSFTSTGGSYYDGQGLTGDFSLNKGFALGDKGYLNVTGEVKYHDFSVQGIGDERYQSPDGALLPGLGYPNENVAHADGFPHENKLNGDPQYNLYNFLYNAGYDVGSGVEFYSFGTFGYRSSQHYENYRPPNRVSGVPLGGDPADPIYPFPTGFDPREKFNETDYSVTGGLKGTSLGWDWDVSSTYGGNQQDVYTINSGNSSLYPILQSASASPIPAQTNFYDGKYSSSQWTNNVNFDREFNVGLASPLNVATGVEYRYETFGISPGEPSSYYGTGAQSFTGYSALDRTDVSRSNVGVYVDLAADLVKGLHTDLAGRYEHYSDFGSDWSGSFTARYDFNPMFAIRGTVADGFRAPTLGEEYYSGTNVSPKFADVQLPPNSPQAALAGFSALKPETSFQFSFGLVAHPISNMQITLDAYQINLDDRILTSGFIYGTCCTQGSASLISPAVLAAIAARGVKLDPTFSYTAISIFSNAANTRTRGLELSATYSTDFNEYGHVDWTLGLNVNKTDITKLYPLPALVSNTPAQCAVLPACNTTFLTPNAATALTDSTPEEKVIMQAFWTWHKWSVNLRETIYGATSQISNLDNVFVENIPVTGITDLDIGFKITPWMKWDMGANNLFNTFPPRAPEIDGGQPADAGLVYHVPYGFSPYGINGGYYYGRVTLTF